MRSLLLVLVLMLMSVVQALPQALLRRATNSPCQTASAPPLAKVTGGTPLPGGSYTVGTGGYFPTLDSAFDRLSGGSILGPVTLLLTDTLYVASPSRSRMFQLTGPIAGTSKTNRLTIRPADGVAARIEGSGEVALFVVDVSYLTLDGVALDGSTRLNVHALYNTQGTQYNDAIDIIGNSDFVNVQNLKADSDDPRRSSCIAMYASNTGGPDSCLIFNNDLPSALNGVCVSGYSYYAPFPVITMPKGIVVRGNRIGSPKDSSMAWGIQCEFLDGGVIEQNEVAHLKNYFSTDVLTFGINTHGCANTIIRQNVVRDLCGHGNARVWGILASGWDYVGTGLQIVNNMIYDIRSIGTGSSVYTSGIALVWRNSDVLVANNTVFLDGSSALPYGTAALTLGSDNIARVTIENNVLVNLCQQLTSSWAGFSSAIRLDGDPSAISVSDHNDLFVGPYETSKLVQARSITFESLTNWQCTGRDAHSVSVQPVFRAPHLHIDTTASANTFLAHAAIPLPSVPFDFDGTPRGSTPDIGAHQFTSPTTAVAAEAPGAMPAAFRLEQNYPNPFNPGTGIRFQVSGISRQSSVVNVKVYDLLGREVAVLVNEEKQAGSYTTRFDGSRLPSGVYLCRMTAGSFSQTRKMMLLK